VCIWYLIRGEFIIRNQKLAIFLFIIVVIPAASEAASCKSYINHIRKQLNQNDQIKQLDWLSLVELQKTLGQGKKTTQPNGLTQYDWACPKNSTDSLTVTFGADGKIATLTGSYSDEQGAEQFSNRIYDNPVLVEETLEERTSKFTGKYHQYFNSELTSIEQIKREALTRIKTFYLAVRNCTPGTYQYMAQDIPGTMFYTSVIKGKQNNNCLVESTFLIPDKATGKKTCQYKPTSQLLYSDAQANFDGAGNFSFDASNITPFQQAAFDDCKYEVKEIKK
jgi:hypothetical protein